MQTRINRVKQETWTFNLESKAPPEQKEGQTINRYYLLANHKLTITRREEHGIEAKAERSCCTIS
jgi:hypothetical protein